MVDSAFQRALADAHDELAKRTRESLKPAEVLEGLAPALDRQRAVRDVRKINDTPNARAATEASMRDGVIRASTLASITEPRLPPSMENRSWDTLRDTRVASTGTAPVFNFAQEVRDFKFFEAVGGGIHLGGRLRVTGDFKRSVVRYDAATQRLLLLDFSGDADYPAVRELAQIDPQSLKALYRYAQSGNNLGVSMGWTGSEIVRVGDMSPVLLDREFVDTRVGQDLMLADQIGWELYERKPNGWIAANRIADPFCKAHKEFLASRKSDFESEMATLSSWAETRVRFTGEGREAALARMSWTERYADPFRYAVLKSQTVAEMVAVLKSMSTRDQVEAAFQPEFAEEIRKEAAEKGVTLTSGQRREILDKAMTDQTKSIRKYLFPMISRLDQDDGKATAAQMAIPSTVGRVRWKEGASRSDLELAAGALEASMGAKVIEEERANVAKALGRAKAASDAEVLAYVLYHLLPSTTLAVMWDEDTELTRMSSGVSLQNRMTYKYATHYREYSPITEVLVAHAPSDPEKTAKTIPSLTNVANGALGDGSLAEAFPPLKRVQAYAQIVALLRWAIQQQGDELGGLDLSDLIWVDSFDPKRTPTPDRMKTSLSPDAQRCS